MDISDNKPVAFIVEDTVDLAYAFSIALESVGFETQTFNDGAIAQSQLKQTTNLSW